MSFAIWLSDLTAGRSATQTDAEEEDVAVVVEAEVADLAGAEEVVALAEAEVVVEEVAVEEDEGEEEMGLTVALVVILLGILAVALAEDQYGEQTPAMIFLALNNCITTHL